MGLPAVVIVAHDQPRQLHRLIEALAPFEVFLHVDANVRAEMFAALTTGLPERVHLLRRFPAGWARPELALAELEGYRRALVDTDAEHIIVCTGTDYPLRSARYIADFLAGHPGKSLVSLRRLPIAEWGPLRGYDRFIAPQRPWRRRRLVWPRPRLWPRPLVPTGGGQQKVISRRHAQLVLRALDSRPELRRYLLSCWIPDEVLVPTILASPGLGVRWEDEHIDGPGWFIDWGRRPSKSPRWLGVADFVAITKALHPGLLFTRKLDDDQDELRERIDRELRCGPG